MKKVLIINASARILNSHSRELTTIFAGHWRDLHKDPVINYRELGSVHISHINEAWIAASFKPVAERTAAELNTLSASDAYVAELRDADVIVLGTPMYNWSIPSTLKAYIDQVLRLNETFRVSPGNAQHPYVGLLRNKTLILLVARGGQGYETGESNSHLNFQTTYLRTVFNMMGIQDVRMVAVDGTSFDKVALKISIEQAHQDIRQLVETLKENEKQYT